MYDRARMIYLPDTMTNWPWPRAINPHYEVVKLEVDASFRDFKALSSKSQEAFDKYDTARLAALAFPNASREHLRIGCDLINVLCIVDEYTDVENEAVTTEMLDIVIDALHNPHKVRPEGECILGEIVRQFWARAIRTASLPSRQHFLQSYTAYLHATVVEARDREEAHCRTINDYFKLRRDTVAAKPTFAIYEMGMNLPDEVFSDPVIVELAECIIDLTLISNDMVSYNREQATGDENHNLITVVMLERNIDLSSAMSWAACYHSEVQKKFIDALAKVPSWGPSIDVLVKEYLHGTANWIRGYNCWSYESQRYFGIRGLEIQQTRLVPLLPKANREAVSSETKDNIADLTLMDAEVLAP